MRKWWLPIVLVSTLSLRAAAMDFDDPEKTDWVEYLFGCTGEICVIRDNPGGFVREFEWASRQALARNTRFVIDGPCESSCVILVSHVRKNVCITENAKIGIHMGFNRHIYDPTGKEVDFRTEEGRRIFQRVFEDTPDGYRVKLNFVELDYGYDITHWAETNGKMPASRKVYTLTREEVLMFWTPCPIEDIK